jgi:hypothetical protein
MKHFVFACVFLSAMLYFMPRLHGQSILYGYPDLGPGGLIASVDLLTCQETVISDNLPPGNFTDFVLMPNGTLYLLGFVFVGGSNFSNAVLIHDPATGTNTLAGTLTGINNLSGSMLALNDSIILITTLDFIHSFNINTNTATVLGSIPGFSGFGESFLYNGQIYITQSTGGNYPSGTYILNLNPVSLTPAPFNGTYFVGVCNQLFPPFQEYNPANGTSNNLCSIPNISSGGGGFLSTAVDPFNSTGPLCNCATETGILSIPPGGTFFNQCSTDPFVLPTPTGTQLDGNDNLVYILAETPFDYNNPSSVLQVYPTSTISFVPGVTALDQIYYVYLVAADAVGSGISFTDPCRDVNGLSFAVRWRTSPTVNFTGTLETCAGECQTLNMQFTGQGPFNLTFQTLTNGTVSGTVTRIFNNFTGTIEICPPVGFTGNFEVKATNLVDAFCTCGQ